MPRKKKEQTSDTPRAPRKTKAPAKAKPIAGSLKTTQRKTRPPASSAPEPGALPKEPGDNGPARAGPRFQLPRLGQTQVVVFVRDPRCLFAYWEISPEREQEVRQEMGPEGQGGYRVLRLLGVAPGPGEALLQEILVHPDEKNRYIHLEDTGGEYVVEVGWQSPGGRFLAFARSRRITTAPGRLSDVIDENWQPPPGMMEYFSEEEPEGLPGPGPSSASMGQIRGLKKRGLGPGRHGASLF